MEAHDTKLTQLLDGSRQYIIPIFQRDYSWGQGQCQQLWDDIVRVGADPNARAHFLGSVVHIAAEDTNADVPRWLVIDGQQRLTTITLLLIAFRDRLKTVGDDDTIPTAAAVQDRFLRNLHAKPDRSAKLHLRRADHDALMALIDQKKTTSTSEHIDENYKLFSDLVAGADLRHVWAGLSKLVVVTVSLKRGQDDPQLIFESLNSTGLDLTQADLIRNFVLMRLDDEEQTRLYEKFWQPMEAAFGARYRTDFDKFARDYLSVKLQPSKQFRSDEIYRRFQDFFIAETGKHSTEDMLAELARYASYFVAYNLGVEKSAALKAAFKRLRQLIDVASPTVLRLYDCYDRTKTLDDNDFVTCIELLESFVFRRSVCDMETRSLGQILTSLAARIDDTRPLESLQVALARQGKRKRFPIDAEFVQSLETRNVYEMRHCFYLLDRLANDSKERVDTSNLTIEHVMPQNENLRTEWRKMLGDDWKTTHQTWLHRLGNLTLTGYNSEYSDLSFDDKKSKPNGFAQSAIRLNHYIAKQSQWTHAEMTTRGSDLAQRAAKLWRRLDVDQALVREAEIADLKAKAKGFDVDTLGMSMGTRALFEALQKKILELGPNVVELFGAKTVTYRVFDFFVEVIPRKNRLTLVLNLDAAECQPLPENAWDTNEQQFIIYSAQDGGVAYKVKTSLDVASSMALVKRAYQQAVD